MRQRRAALSRGCATLPDGGGRARSRLVLPEHSRKPPIGHRASLWERVRESRREFRSYPQRCQAAQQGSNQGSNHFRKERASIAYSYPQHRVPLREGAYTVAWTGLPFVISRSRVRLPPPAPSRSRTSSRVTSRFSERVPDRCREASRRVLFAPSGVVLAAGLLEGRGGAAGRHHGPAALRTRASQVSPARPVPSPPARARSASASRGTWRRLR